MYVLFCSVLFCSVLFYYRTYLDVVDGWGDVHAVVYGVKLVGVQEEGGDVQAHHAVGGGVRRLEARRHHLGQALETAERGKLTFVMLIKHSFFYGTFNKMFEIFLISITIVTSCAVRCYVKHKPEIMFI